MNEKIYYLALAPFESARKIDFLPKENPSSNLHGHSFVGRLRVADQTSTNAVNPLDDIQKSFEQVVKTLDYRFLNEILDSPTDENLSRHIRANTPLTHIDTVGVQSTKNQGADIDSNDNAHIWKKFRFEAAHKLPNVPDGHPCGRLHGHGFEVTLHVMQNVKDKDMGTSFETIDAQWQNLDQLLSKKYLNNIKGLENPTSEMISQWIWVKLKPTLPDLSWVSVYETKTAGCHFDGSLYRIWKDQSFESAVKDENIPDMNSRVFGHSYLLRLHLTCPLDTVMGWTIDYGDVKKAFKPIYDQLDHYPLQSIEKMRSNRAADILRWIKDQASDRLPELDRMDLYETPARGASIYWGDSNMALPV